MKTSAFKIKILSFWGKEYIYDLLMYHKTIQDDWLQN